MLFLFPPPLPGAFNQRTKMRIGALPTPVSGARHRRCLDQPDHGHGHPGRPDRHGHRHGAGPRGLDRLLDRARPRGAGDPGRRRITCTAGEPPTLSTFNITKISARLDFATSESDFRGWRRIFPGARIRDRDRSCQAASGVDLSRLRAPRADHLPVRPGPAQSRHLHRHDPRLHRCRDRRPVRLPQDRRRTGHPDARAGGRGG